MKRLKPEAVRLPTVADGRRMQPARGDARGCLVFALPILETAQMTQVAARFLFVRRALASRSGYRYHMIGQPIEEGT
jgi:hypothetical protein